MILLLVHDRLLQIILALLRSLEHCISYKRKNIAQIRKGQRVIVNLGGEKKSVLLLTALRASCKSYSYSYT